MAEDFGHVVFVGGCMTERNYPPSKESPESLSQKEEGKPQDLEDALQSFEVIHRLDARDHSLVFHFLPPTFNPESTTTPPDYEKTLHT